VNWEFAIICPFYKRNGEPSNYTGIFLLSVSGKIFLGSLAGRLRD
jgi:hypothetical protein